MKRPMIFMQSYYDVQRLDGINTISFFTESDENHTSVTSLIEDRAIRWLLQKDSFRYSFIESFFENPKMVKSYFGLTEPFTVRNQKPGDIDLLLVDTGRPHKAIAIECKRVKVTSINNKESKVNNASVIQKGVIQANNYQSLGFHQSYLMIILLDDSRQLNTHNTIMRYGNSENVELIYDIPWNEEIHNDVGIIFVRVTQPTGKDFNLMGGIGFCIDKKAGLLDQTPTMTNKIKELLKSKT